MTDSTFVQLLTLVGGLGGVAALLNAIWSRKRAPADAASILTKAASGLVLDLQKRIDVLEKRQRRQETANREHRKWDIALVLSARAVGIEAPDPPSLNPDDYPDEDVTPHP